MIKAINLLQQGIRCFLDCVKDNPVRLVLTFLSDELRDKNLLSTEADNDLSLFLNKHYPV